MYREDVGGGENDVTVTYTYDANGMRIGKTVTTNTYHAHSYTAVVTAPTCTVDGYTTYTCACGDSYVGDVTDATGHTYTEAVTAPTCTADGYTTYTCACGDSYTGNTTAALGHELVETTVDGSVLYTCNRCDYSATHVHSYTAVVTAPTCTADGYTTYTCSCGDSYQGDVVAATGHNGSFLISEPATCTEDGYEDYYCQTCGEVYTIVLPAPGHTWTEGGLVPYCTVCNYGRTGDPAFWSLRNTDLVSSVEETYSYVYNGSLLTQMTKDGTSLLFVYDAFGTPSELRYNNVYYHYVINLQGDVIAILDEYGAVVVEYTYDAWGNILTVTGSLASTLGKLNPLTYRGYVYDWETGLYYLQSRYYNPERGRFINADALVSTGQGILGNNMFAYCNNNPVNCADSTGMATDAAQWWIATMWWLGLADSVLPVGDAVYGAGILFFELMAIGTISGTSALQPQEQEEQQEQQEQEDKHAEPLPLPKTNESGKKQVIFPKDPNNFNPVGLEKVYHEGTKNGALISWMDPITNTEVFRWDENPMYVNGPHYHIRGKGHYIPGVHSVPEPYATIYFPFGIWGT